ncbi:MAG: hypothetical protein ACK5LD_06475 [Pseudanabaena sp.]
MASTSLSQPWLSEVEAVGTLINRKSLRTKKSKVWQEYIAVLNHL